MAEALGQLRTTATHGEKFTLNALQKNLPKEFFIYVEMPIRNFREIRYPDFTVLTNYGVILLEVKDWFDIMEANPDGARIRTQKGLIHFEYNPVSKAREFAIALEKSLKKAYFNNSNIGKIPWGYAAIIIGVPTTTITQLRKVWGEDFVFGEKDLQNSNILLTRLKNTISVKHIRQLTKVEINAIRDVVYPIVGGIQHEGEPPKVLDHTQERIVVEPVRPTLSDSSTKLDVETKESQGVLIDVSSAKQKNIDKSSLENNDRLGRNLSIRLVRGFAGTGKTLVLERRARYLDATFPEWKIGVFAFNRDLKIRLANSLKGTRVITKTFDKLCQEINKVQYDKPFDTEKWLKENQSKHDFIRTMGPKWFLSEFEWMRDIGTTDRNTYLSIERRGRGKEGRLSTDQRNKVFDIFSLFRKHLEDNGLWDWPESRQMALNKLLSGTGPVGEYDAVLVDEAQDFSPVWCQILNLLLKPKTGLLFLTDDPSQSIYRYFSWKEKGIPVAGRTRWLRAPYRTTIEVFQAAYHLIDNPAIQSMLNDLGEIAEEPDLSKEVMRHGPRPTLRKFMNFSDEMTGIGNLVQILRASGKRDDQIAVLTRTNREKDEMKRVLQAPTIDIKTMHSFKGAERSVVVIPHLQNLFKGSSPEEEAAERRLVYVAMSRARHELHMTYSGSLPKAFVDLQKNNLVDTMK